MSIETKMAALLADHDTLNTINSKLMTGVLTKGEWRVMDSIISMIKNRELVPAWVTEWPSQQEPVADVVAWHKPGEERTCDIRWRRFDVAPGPLYAAQQLAPDMRIDFSLLRAALSNAGIAAPETNEELGARYESYVHQLLKFITKTPETLFERGQRLAYQGYGISDIWGECEQDSQMDEVLRGFKTVKGE